MAKSVEGIYRNGKVDPLEPLQGADGGRVIVTLVVPSEPVGLSARGIDESQAADLRRRLSPFAEDWDRPEMSVYDEPGSDIRVDGLPSPANRVAAPHA